MAENDDLLADLLKHPGWEVLRQRLNERREMEFERVGRKILSTTKPLDQLEYAEKRGFWRGTDWFLQRVESGARAFDRENEDGEKA